MKIPIFSILLSSLLFLSAIGMSVGVYRVGVGKEVCMSRMVQHCIHSCQLFETPLALLRIKRTTTKYPTYCICGNNGRSETVSATTFNYEKCVKNVAWSFHKE